MELQPSLEDERVRLRPLRVDDFPALYAVASDPLIWEQHPNKDRYRHEVFSTYFAGAMQSAGAFLVSDAQAGDIVGSTRYYEFDAAAGTVAIGYTFLARRCWGGGYNHSMKTLLLEHAFQHVGRVIFHVGENNRRSRVAMERLGGVHLGTEPISYYGETANINVIYAIDRDTWRAAARSPS